MTTKLLKTEIVRKRVMGAALAAEISAEILEYRKRQIDLAAEKLLRGEWSYAECERMLKSLP
jgi:hypothetical protein